MDWSSTLPSGNNSYNYPSVNLSYVFSESLNVPWMNMGKIRAGYARVGGDAPVFATSLYYGTLGNAINGVPLGNVDNNVPNPQIEPLQVTELEVGGEMEFLQKRLFVDLAWYKKQTLNDIVNVGISRGSGYQTAVVNIAEIENTGVEFPLGGVPRKPPALTWTTTFNISNNKNTVITLAEGQDKLTVGESRNGRRSLSM